MHTIRITDQDDREWTVNHNGDLSGGIVIKAPPYYADFDVATIPGEVILELVGQHLQMEVIADLEDMAGELIRALKRMGEASRRA